MDPKTDLISELLQSDLSVDEIKTQLNEIIVKAKDNIKKFENTPSLKRFNLRQGVKAQRVLSVLNKLGESECMDSLVATETSSILAGAASVDPCELKNLGIVFNDQQQNELLGIFRGIAADNSQSNTTNSDAKFASYLDKLEDNAIEDHFKMILKDLVTHLHLVQPKPDDELSSQQIVDKLCLGEGDEYSENEQLRATYNKVSPPCSMELKQRLQAFVSSIEEELDLLSDDIPFDAPTGVIKKLNSTGLLNERMVIAENLNIALNKVIRAELILKQLKKQFKEAQKKKNKDISIGEDTKLYVQNLAIEKQEMLVETIYADYLSEYFANLVDSPFKNFLLDKRFKMEPIELKDLKKQADLFPAEGGFTNKKTCIPQNVTNFNDVVAGPVLNTEYRVHRCLDEDRVIGDFYKESDCNGRPGKSSCAQSIPNIRRDILKAYTDDAFKLRSTINASRYSTSEDAFSMKDLKTRITTLVDHAPQTLGKILVKLGGNNHELDMLCMSLQDVISRKENIKNAKLGLKIASAVYDGVTVVTTFAGGAGIGLATLKYGGGAVLKKLVEKQGLRVGLRSYGKFTGIAKVRLAKKGKKFLSTSFATKIKNASVNANTANLVVNALSDGKRFNDLELISFYSNDPELTLNIYKEKLQLDSYVDSLVSVGGSRIDGIASMQLKMIKKAIGASLKNIEAYEDLFSASKKIKENLKTGLAVGRTFERLVGTIDKLSDPETTIEAYFGGAKALDNLNTFLISSHYLNGGDINVDTTLSKIDLLIEDRELQAAFSSYSQAYQNYMNDEKDVSKFFEDNPQFRAIGAHQMNISSALSKLNQFHIFCTQGIEHCKIDELEQQIKNINSLLSFQLPSSWR